MTKKPQLTIGLEAIAAHVPRYFLDLKSLAEHNGVEWEKYTVGLGVNRMSLTAPDEDPVTMAVEATQALFERYGLDKSRIGLIAVGTESAVDGAKPIAAYVHGMLGFPNACRTFDTQHACYAATAAMRAATDWVAARSGSGMKALVIATDISRYEVGSPGEPTQGAGAVAMVVGENPALLALDPAREAVFTNEIMDFWRPNYRSTALVDGKTSINSYLRGCEATFEQYRQNSGLSWDDYDFMLFHVPFPKMAYKAYRRLFEKAKAPHNGNGEAEFERSFEERALPALWANREMGNVYSGSLFLSLAGLLEREAERVENARLGFFSYGSGSCSEFFSGLVGPDASVWRGRVGIAEGLKRRQEVSYREYLELLEKAELMARDGSWRENGSPETNGRALFHGIREHRRIYSFMTDMAATAAGEVLNGRSLGVR